MRTYRALDAREIIATIDRLERRIAERFPGSGLAGVCHELGGIARDASGKAERLSRPNGRLQIGVAAFVLLVAAALALPLYAFAGSIVKYFNVPTELPELAQGLEAVINTLIFAGLGLAFLFGLDGRIRRKRAMEELHELRSVIHVIDMHQLTKDPSFTSGEARRTSASPDHGMNEFQLTRYLDYCSEMLSLTGKIAALYAQGVKDPGVSDSVNAIEMLSANLSRKIWQKITILQTGVTGSRTAPLGMRE